MPIRIEVRAEPGASSAWIIRQAEAAAKAVRRTKAELAVVFLGPGRIKALNSYRGKDEATDILSFPADRQEDLGDIFICPPMARRKAKERGMSYRDYLRLLIVHGVLHLAGHDHVRSDDAKKMERLEKKILSQKP